MTASQGFGLVGAGLQLAGGISSFYASRAQATIAKQQGRIDSAVANANATALELQGEYNAGVQRNNAIAQANQKNYESSIVKANRLGLIQNYENTRTALVNKVRATKASTFAANVNLSKDVLNSLEMEAFNEIAHEDLAYTMELQSMGAQLTENDRTAKLSRLYGEAQANNTLAGARNNAFFTRLSGQNAQTSANLRAGQMKMQATSNLIGSFASAAGSAATYV